MSEITEADIAYTLSRAFLLLTRRPLATSSGVLFSSLNNLQL